MNLSGKVVLITGGTSGIGASCAEELLRNNVKGVAIADINETERVQNLNEKYGKVTFIKADVANRESFESAFQATVDVYNNVNILINSAGILNEFNVEKTILVNLLGTVLGCDLAINTYFPKYKTDFDTYIINIASIAGLLPGPVAVNYSASKHGVIGLTRSYGANKTVAKQGVRIMAVCPGLTSTPMVDCSSASSIVYHEHLEKEMSLFPIQEVETVSQSVLQVLQNAESGSVWLINECVLSKVNLPTYKTIMASK